MPPADVQKRAMPVRTSFAFAAGVTNEFPTKIQRWCARHPWAMLLAMEGCESSAELPVPEIAEATARTLASYQAGADAYRDETRTRERAPDHDLFFRYLRAQFPSQPTYSLLDVGCGPGRDLAEFRARGHRAMGLDGCAAFVDMAQLHSGCPVLHQDLRAPLLPVATYDGIFACGSLFHVPPAALPQTLRALRQSLRAGGVLFTLNPRGEDQSGWVGDRFCCYLRLQTWRRLMTDAGWMLRTHTLRPLRLPRAQRQWIAAIWIATVT